MVQAESGLNEDLTKFSVVDVEHESSNLRVVDEGTRSKGFDGRANVRVDVFVGSETKGRTSTEGGLDLLHQNLFVERLESTASVVDDHHRLRAEQSLAE